MNWTKITSIALFVISIGLAYYFYSRIKFAIDEEKRIVAQELAVINKLSMIRDAELSYLNVKGEYTTSWDSLANFMENGDFYIIQRTEEIITLSYGADSSVFHSDTLGIVKVYDSLFNEQKYPGLNFNAISTIPGSTANFDIFTDEIIKGGVTVNVIEVRDTAPVNPNRLEKNEARNKKPLRFGSRTDVTTAGNWE